jgi:hypothetical protein
MRLPVAVASILAIGLVAAACGGDDATSEPTEAATAAPIVTEAAAEAPAEAATEAPAEATEQAAAEPEFGKKAQHSSTDDPEATYALTSGRYRMEWSTNKDECEQVDILVSQVDGDFSYPKPSKSSYATATINDLPEGLYKIEQLDPGCTEWTIRVDWMTN